MVKKAIFWDRDGVINELVDSRPPRNTNEFKFKPTIQEAILESRILGFLNFVVTNQPDFPEHITQEQLGLMHAMIVRWLGIDDFDVAFVRGSVNYKPNTGMIDYLASKWNINLSKSYMIGDTWKDIVCGYRTGLNTIFIGEKYTTPVDYADIYPNHIVNTPIEAMFLIREMEYYD